MILAPFSCLLGGLISLSTAVQAHLLSSPPASDDLWNHRSTVVRGARCSRRASPVIGG